jgi:hypothetical protein
MVLSLHCLLPSTRCWILCLLPPHQRHCDPQRLLRPPQRIPVPLPTPCPSLLIHWYEPPVYIVILQSHRPSSKPPCPLHHPTSVFLPPRPCPVLSCHVTHPPLHLPMHYALTPPSSPYLTLIPHPFSLLPFTGSDPLGQYVPKSSSVTLNQGQQIFLELRSCVGSGGGGYAKVNPASP